VRCVLSPADFARGRRLACRWTSVCGASTPSHGEVIYKRGIRTSRVPVKAEATGNQILVGIPGLRLEHTALEQLGELRRWLEPRTGAKGGAHPRVQGQRLYDCR
jgi:hypothetical protein